MLCSGNHKRTWENSGLIYNGCDSGGECGVPIETLYYVPAENRAKFCYVIHVLYYSKVWQQKNTHIYMLTAMDDDV